nr:T-box transcription factor TBX20-like isoform X2 [Crassostrea virginica]
MESTNMSLQNSDGPNIKQSKVHEAERKSSTKRVSSNTSSSPASSNESSSSEMEVQSSDMDVCQVYANSSSSGYSGMQSSSSDTGKSREDISDDNDDCIPLINGSITLSLMEAKLWYKFLEVGTEMIINRTGRRMFPYVEFSLRGVDPVGLYDVIFDIIPASSKSFKFLNNKWIPIGRKEEEYKNYPFKHPDSPRIGSEWMTRKISFEKVKLSNKPGTKAGIFTLHTLQKYLVRISIVKHERDDELSVVEFPIRATTFIAVTAYNNRDVTKLKINSNPYSKGFRFPMKRLKNHAFEQLDAKEQRMVTLEDPLKSSVYGHLKKEIPAFPQCPLDLSTNKDTSVTNNIIPCQKKIGIDKATQTDITMSDIRSWYYFLGYPLVDRYPDMNMLLYNFCPHIPRNTWEQEQCSGGQSSEFADRYSEPKSSNHYFITPTKDNEKEKKNASKSNERERGKREERLMEYNARIEMWKRDRESSRSDNPEPMKK